MFGDGLEQLRDRHVCSNNPQEDPVVPLDAQNHLNEKKKKKRLTQLMHPVFKIFKKNYCLFN